MRAPCTFGSGDRSSCDQLVRRFAERFWTVDWPGTSRPRVYFDPRALELEGPGGVLRAKVPRRWSPTRK